MRRFLAGGLAAILVLAAGVACDDDNGTGNDLETEFAATLTGAAERPTAVTTTASGTADVEIDDEDETITVTVNVTGLSNITMAHIHVGNTSTAGPIALTLTGVAVTGVFTGALVSNVVFTADDVEGSETFDTLVAKIRSGQAYINVHTTAYPNGEIRGQLVAD